MPPLPGQHHRDARQGREPRSPGTGGTRHPVRQGDRQHFRSESLRCQQHGGRRRRHADLLGARQQGLDGRDRLRLANDHHRTLRRRRPVDGNGRQQRRIALERRGDRQGHGAALRHHQGGSRQELRRRKPHGPYHHQVGRRRDREGCRHAGFRGTDHHRRADGQYAGAQRQPRRIGCRGEIHGQCPLSLDDRPIGRCGMVRGEPRAGCRQHRRGGNGQGA